MRLKKLPECKPLECKPCQYYSLCKKKHKKVTLEETTRLLAVQDYALRKRLSRGYFELDRM